MDITPQKPTHWPAARAQRGVVYQVNDPVYQDTQLAVQTLESWLDFGTRYEVLTRKVAAQDKAIVQLNATNQVLVAQLAALQEKHHNLREATRKERTDKLTNSMKATP